MKSLLPAVLAGALCLPATFGLTRWGGQRSILIALVGVVVLGVLAGAVPSMFMSKGDRKPRMLHLLSAFAAGSLASELIAFTCYYLLHGYKDRYLTEGAVIAVLEFVGIAAFGGTGTCIGACVAALVRRITGSG